MQQFWENPKIAYLIFVLEMRTFNFRFEKHLIFHLIFTEAARSLRARVGGLFLRPQWVEVSDLAGPFLALLKPNAKPKGTFESARRGLQPNHRSKYLSSQIYERRQMRSTKFKVPTFMFKMFTSKLY